MRLPLLTLGLEINLPTGKEQLSNRQRLAEFGDNHDVFEVDDFGEGLKIGGQIGVADTFGAVSASLNARYAINGEYDPTTDLSDDDFDPGDQFQITGLLTWNAAAWFKVDASMAYSYFTEDRRNGETAFQEGAKLALGVNMQVLSQVYRPLRVIAGVQLTVQAKDKELHPEEGLKTEYANSNGRDIFAGLDVLYETSPRLALRAVGDMRYYGESERKDVVPYEGKRQRFALGPGLFMRRTGGFPSADWQSCLCSNRNRIFDYSRIRPIRASICRWM